MSEMVQTVTGPIDSDHLGVTTIHEHIFHDTTVLLPRYEVPGKERFEDEPVSLENLWWMRSGGWNRDNLVLDDMSLAIREVGHFCEAGGRCMVEMTPASMGRDVEGLRTVSQATGVHIVAASGYACGAGDSRPRSVEERAEEYVSEVEVGIDGTDIRAGVLQLLPLSRIGIASVDEMLPVDADGIRATAEAQLRTGVALSVEPPTSTRPQEVSRADIGFAVLEMILEAGVRPDRVAVTTLDGNVYDCADRSRAIRRIADTGAYIQMGLWGAELYAPTVGADGQRLSLVEELVAEGYSGSLLFGHDTASKMRLRSYGGKGYAHIVRTIAPMLVKRGMPEATVDQILVDNPRRLLAQRQATEPDVPPSNDGAGSPPFGAHDGIVVMDL